MTEPGAGRDLTQKTALEWLGQAHDVYVRDAFAARLTAEYEAQFDQVYRALLDDDDIAVIITTTTGLCRSGINAAVELVFVRLGEALGDGDDQTSETLLNTMTGDDVWLSVGQILWSHAEAVLTDGSVQPALRRGAEALRSRVGAAPIW